MKAAGNAAKQPSTGVKQSSPSKSPKAKSKKTDGPPKEVATQIESEKKPNVKVEKKKDTPAHTPENKEDKVKTPTRPGDTLESLEDSLRHARYHKKGSVVHSRVVASLTFEAAAQHRR
ncbi:unnamed protein product [Strongylus vulgaris]|uniref:Uncharacterized protein n=1 Tax=Strongylus vulgaris TaxID=40348 RepID=A0A3P7I1U6_STRVU|nr:unnamed protein product [Strongylus vulgaris]